MKLLILTQKIDINDSVLGFFHRWVIEFAKNYEAITVVCLEKGEYKLPDNVRVFSLGKESGKSRLEYLMNFFSYVWRERRAYDSVFVHMNQEYVLLAGLLWRAMGKRVLFWRNHPQGTFLTRCAVVLANVVFCTSPFAYTARFKKTRVMPVGIDTEQFAPVLESRDRMQKRLIYIGRISPVKHIDLILEAVSKMREHLADFVVDLYGEPVPRAGDIAYYESLKNRVLEKKEENVIRFHPAVPNREVPRIYAGAFVSANVTTTGSMDKSIFEAMACGVPVVTSNPALSDFDPSLISRENDADDLAQKLTAVLKMSEDDRSALGLRARDYVVKNHSLQSLVSTVRALS